MDSKNRGRIKRGLTIFLYDQEAVATVFFLLVGGALLTMFLALFNYGRYYLAVRQMEKALASSAASVLSYYQPSLTKEMGLFALDVRNPALQDIGKAYFVDNLGKPGAVNGQQCLDYSLSFPEGSHLDLGSVLMAQAVDTKRIEGWTGIGLDLLAMFDLTDWMSVLDAPGDDAEVRDALGLPLLVDESGVTGITDGIAEDVMGTIGDTNDVTGDTATEIEYPDWLKQMDENANQSGGSTLKFWQLLLPFPPDDRFHNRKLPTSSANIWKGISGVISGSGDFWENTFTDPISAVQKEGFFSDSIGDMKGFLTDFTGSLTRALEKGKNKILFDEYLLQELDFATNKPVVNRYFSRCEVEYILCGFDNAWDNIRVTALDIYLLRTCVYIVGSLLEGKVVDKITLVKEAVNAIIRGSEDVEKLFAGQRIPIYPKFSQVTMSYKDHLRLFLFCQGEVEQRKALQRLVQVNLWYWSGGQPGSGSGSELGLETGAGAGNEIEAEFIGATLANAAYELYDLHFYTTKICLAAETEVPLWPFGAVRIHREGVMGYDRPFELLSP